MASVTACSQLLVLTCGDKVAVVDFSHPEEAVILCLPKTQNAAPQSKAHGSTENLKAEGSAPNGHGKNSEAKTSESDINRILATDVSPDGQYLALCDDHKYLHVFRCEDGETKNWTIISSRCVSRRCTRVRFDSAQSKVLVADKSGDVFSFPIHSVDPTMTSERNDPEVSQSENQERQQSQGDDQPMETDGSDHLTVGGQLLLGHLSMLLDMILLEQDSLVITADRDEKIRVSRYPDCYNIHTYCLGHAAFVISLAWDSERRLLFSGSGDCTVRAWSYRQGKELALRCCLEDFPSQTQSQSRESEKGQASSEDKPIETTANPASDSNAFQPAVQQICYCQSCCLLFVAMYKSPHILVYHLLSPSDQDGAYVLEPQQAITGQGDVISFCVQGCVLWCLRGEDNGSRLKLTANRVEQAQDGFKITALTSDGSSDESKILKTMSNQEDFFKDAPAQQDLSILWKSHIDGFVDKYLERKRQRIEGKEIREMKGRKRKAKHKRS